MKPFGSFFFLVGCLGTCDQVSFLGSMVRREHKPSDLLFMGPDRLFLYFGHSLMPQEMQFSSYTFKNHLFEYTLKSFMDKMIAYLGREPHRLQPDYC